MPEGKFIPGRYATSTALLIALLLFLLPFTEIRCNDTPFASNTGLGLALGRDYKINEETRSLGDRLGDKNSVRFSTESEDGKLYVAALAALLLGIAGFASSLLIARTSITSIVTSLLAAVALIILMVQIKQEVHNQTVDRGMTSMISDRIKITAVFSPWYYLSIASFLVAAFFSYQQWRELKVEDPDDTD